LFVRDDVGHGLLQDVSLSEVEAYCFEKQGPGAPDKHAILVPALNQNRVKGFLVFYDPPIEANSPRTFETGCRLNREFKGTLGMGRQDEVGLVLQQRARTHRINELAIEVWFHPELPEVKVTPGFKANVTRVTANHESRVYRVIRCSLTESLLVSSQAKFVVTLAAS
jgi:hypothetical protein